MIEIISHPVFAALCELKNLQVLALGFNNLSGIIPPCLGNLTSLKILDLSSNRLEGDISSFQIFNLKDLKLIDLTDNLFEGLFSFYSIANFTNLEGLMLSNLEVQTQYSQDWLPTFQLKVLVLSKCKFYNIPQFLAYQTKVRVIDLSHNNLNGIFPNWLFENNTKLEFLSLRNNSLTGQFHLSSNSSYVMRSIDISDNHLHGELQPNLGDLFSKARELNLSSNAFEGHIPFSIGHMPELHYLDLSNNMLSGEIATTLVGLANFSNLVILAASNNKLYGQIPNSINMTSLMSLQLSGNRITGNLSSWISYYPSFSNLDISDNHITGGIPPSIGNQSNISQMELNMAGNELEGRIPSELARLNLLYLDLSHNFLSGPIPSFFNSPSLQHFNLEGNRLTGSIPESLFNFSKLLTLNIRDNLLSSHIPSSIGALSNLRVLLLSRNSLGGLIPDQMCQLNELGILDLSDNLFSGPIPRCFGNISFGKLTLSEFGYQSLLRYDDNGFIIVEIRANLLYSFSLFFSLNIEYGKREKIGFVTKTRPSIYEGRILEMMSGLDLSCNKLTGEIPAEFGTLSSIHALNLSHNQLRGFIPTTFANLRQIESLDLSHNKLSGEIPSKLIGLTFLSYFNVAYNNLSGRLPNMDWQFQTFDSKSYEGNPFLCGHPLRSCNVIHDIPQVAPSNTDMSEEKWYHIDPLSFTASFMGSYLVFLVAFALVLYINPGWRRMLFMFIENLIDECYFLVFYTVPKLFATLYK
uniref:LRR receptor-like serine/threonine-protein kinase FLS2 n=2 Tax=Rhizophora mucronata TaxID=61149 RepID=A0A2P2MS24_RHIMU